MGARLLSMACRVLQWSAFLYMVTSLRLLLTVAQLIRPLDKFGLLCDLLCNLLIRGLLSWLVGLCLYCKLCIKVEPTQIA
jgi:hypothetical protein